jgi:protein TonB
MLPESILQSDVLDIIFENRNKQYGAYTLRREYDANMRKAILITFSLAELLLLFTFCFKQKNNIVHPSAIPDIFTLKPLPLTASKKPDVPKKHQNILPKKTIRAVASITQPTKTTIVQDNLTDRNILTTNEVLNKSMADIKTDGPENISQQSVIGNGENNDGKESGAGVSADNKKITGPIINPDVYPEFPGGKEALLRFLKRNLNDPKTAEDGQTTSVRVRFVVNADGSISGFEVVESGGDDFDKEVLRVLKKMPRWLPGKSNGNDVSVYFEVPVKFVPDDNQQ